MKLIPLTKGRYAIVDDEWFDYLNQWKWFYHSQGYAARSTWNPRTIVFMHREIMKASKGKLVDHINGNKVDNRKFNLRFCTARQNNVNCKIHITNKSGYRGVSWKKELKKWVAVCYLNNKVIYLGLFDKPHHAALARDLWMIDLHGKYASTNFSVVAYSKKRAA
jgi:AP2 domain.